MSVLRVLNTEGDTTYKWDVNDKDSVKEVRAQFDAIMTAQKGMAFRVDSPTSGEVIKSFDPSAQEIIITRPMAGG